MDKSTMISQSKRNIKWKALFMVTTMVFVTGFNPRSYGVPDPDPDIPTNVQLNQNNQGYYQICNVNDLEAFYNIVEDGETGANAVIMNDIDLNPDKEINKNTLRDSNFRDSLRKWKPINYYRGNLDGNNHTIRGMYIVEEANDETIYLGFMGRTNGAHISNLNITNSYIEGISINNVDEEDFEDTVDCYAGAFVGEVKGGSITNCTFNGYIHGNSITGGIVGSAQEGATITNCTNDGCICGEAVRDTDGNINTLHIGGISGNMSNSTMSGCTNNGYVAGKAILDGDFGDVAHIGGLTGNLDMGTVTQCTNNGMVYGLHMIWEANLFLRIGGMVGKAWQGNITNCGGNGDVIVDRISAENSLSISTIVGYSVGGNISGNNYVGSVENNIVSEGARGTIVQLIQTINH